MRRCYHLPADITVPDGLPAVAGQRLAAVLADAVGRAVRAAAPGETAVPQPNPRPEPKEWVGPTRGGVDIPSYDDGSGRKVRVPVVSDVLTTSVGEPFADSLTADELRAQVTLLVQALERGVADAATRTAMTQNLEFLEAYAAAHGITLPAATAHEFRQVLTSHVADLKRHLEALRQLATDVPPPTELGMTLTRDRFVQWHLDHLAWIEEATRHAATLVAEAEGGGPGSAQKFADAGTELTTAIFGLRALAIILAYEGLNYEVATRYPVTDLPLQGVRLVHHSLDTVLQGLRNRLPGAIDAAVEAVARFDWGFDFSELRDEVERQIEEHARFAGWLHVAMLAWTAFDIWMLPVLGAPPRGGGGPPRIGGMGGMGGATATATVSVLSSAEVVAALRRLVATGAVKAPELVKLLGGRTGEIQAPPKPIEASGKPAGSRAPKVEDRLHNIDELLGDPAVRAARKDKSFEGELKGRLRDHAGKTLKERFDEARKDAAAARDLGNQELVKETQRRVDAIRAEIESVETTLRRITEGDLPNEPIVEGPFAADTPVQAATRARVEQSPELRANFRRQLAPREVEGAREAEGVAARPGHARSSHKWTREMQAELLNKPDNIFTGVNDNGFPVDVYYRKNGDVAITAAGSKKDVITSYGPSDPDGAGSVNPITKWKGQKTYIEIEPRNGRPKPPE